jgi:hypothetical protein
MSASLIADELSIESAIFDPPQLFRKLKLSNNQQLCTIKAAR